MHKFEKNVEPEIHDERVYRLYSDETMSKLLFESPVCTSHKEAREAFWEAFYVTWEVKYPNGYWTLEWVGEDD